MGKETVDTQSSIDRLTNQIKKDQEKIQKANDNLRQAYDEMTDVENGIREACWTFRTEIPDDVKKVWTGTGRKDSFRDELLPRIAAIKPDDIQPDLRDIERRIAIVFDDNANTVPEIPTIQLSQLVDYEDEPILQKKIVGREDLPLGALIKKLENSDWVSQGIDYATEGDICPFCQQP
ncbi:AAA family ATPase [Adlercreutzia sp. ZJ304]|uniref:AAA family ATPase n=1 Tax=Adlercreutzia sp. ZJ304 TaxID=2709791 RepID=UPI0013EA9572|nr:AAA family ATPase [Adlercreutzia sp. ZJ304]